MRFELFWAARGLGRTAILNARNPHRMMLTYCTTCVMPTTRPGLTLDASGVCDACRSVARKREVDWEARRRELDAIFARVRRRHDHEYDCIVPVSGGKDSVYQTHMVRHECDMNPLCITFRPLSRTRRGEENLQALRNLGVDHIDFAPNPDAINTITRASFEQFGDCSLVDHLAIYNFVPNLARRFNIPLVIWGENPFMEYGGDESKSGLNEQTARFVRDHHILKGRQALEWGQEGVTRRELQSLVPPDEAELDALGYTPIFLGYYIPWDARHNIEIAAQHGFRRREAGPIMGLYDYADLDCMNIVIHHYFKWLKFGHNRITDNASNEIRKGRLTRAEAIELVKAGDGVKPPREYIAAFCRQIGIDEPHFWSVAERFRNQDIWKRDDNGEWYLEGWIGGDRAPDRFPHTELAPDEKTHWTMAGPSTAAR